MKKMVGIFFLISISHASFAGQWWSQPKAIEEKVCLECNQVITNYTVCDNGECGRVICDNCDEKKANNANNINELIYSKNKKKFFIYAACRVCNQHRRIYEDESGSAAQRSIFLNSRNLHLGYSVIEN